jgi:(1->4)-alpha-D-glucan 1-alpha-D-glucosylmutase
VRTAPRATYRVQLRREFDFDAARAIVPYLSDLGITHLYCSPYMQAAAGSAHGYDVVDPSRVSEELGGDAGLVRLDAELRLHGMGQLLDIVPNHMCVTDARNRFWWDVLRRGRDSEFAHFFDIDWDAPALEGRVLLPVLGDELEAVLQHGDLRVVRGDGGLELRYDEHRFPLADQSLAVEGETTADLLDAQHYRLAFWRTGLRHINYRRFFDVSSLAGVRVEDPSVFAATHKRALELVRDGVVDGLRVDHIDGLREPDEYLRRLRDATGEAWVVVEKILAMGEDMRKSWPVEGTTGYDFGARVVTLLTDPDGLSELDACYREITGDQSDFAAHSRRGRLDVVETLFVADLARLERTAAAAGIDAAAHELTELVVGMPVYRVYPNGWEQLSEPDRASLDTAVAAARECDQCDASKLEALAAVLRSDGEDSAAKRDLRLRFQQLSSATMAKGVEDTAFYRHVRLVALNEVGCDPTRVTSINEFHEACAAVQSHHPRTMLATATHDTKRGEDARIRVAMLSEMPREWREAVLRIRALVRRHGWSMPSPVAEYLLYQTLVAASPITADRAAAYMLKAVRDAKQETSWLDPDAAYEAKLDAFVRRVVEDGAIQDEVRALVDAMTPAWQVASLSQALLKLTAPGVPDIYQGCELWDLHLVDPDNRTPVDFNLRRRLLRELDDLSTAEILQRADEALPKLHLIRAALHMRTRRAAAFAAESTYAPLLARGERAAHAVAYARGTATEPAAVVVLAVRLACRLHGDWGDTTLEVPDTVWRNVLSGAIVNGGIHTIADLVSAFPVMLLERAA